MKLEKNNIINLIKQNMNLFEAFDEVYVFGSILDSEKYSNDIDILLLYSNFSYGILASISSIIKCIEHLTSYPVDITALSFEEEKEVDFIGRLDKKYICIKRCR